MRKYSVFFIFIVVVSILTASCKKVVPKTVIYTKDFFRVVYDSGEIYKWYILRPADFIYEGKEKDIVYSNAKIIFENDRDNIYAVSNEEDLLDSTVVSEDEFINKWIGYNDTYGRYTVTETYTNGYTSIDDALEDIPEKDYFINYKKGKIQSVSVWESADTQMHKTLNYNGEKFEALFWQYSDMKVAWKNDSIFFLEFTKWRTSEGRLLDWVEKETPWLEDDQSNWGKNTFQEVVDKVASASLLKESDLFYLEYKSTYVDNDGWLRLTFSRWLVPNSEEDIPKTVSGNTVNKANLREANLTDETLRSIYLDTIKYWQYDVLAYDYNYTLEQRLNSGRGICFDYALYFYNKCIENGIGNVHIAVSNELKHAWNELWYNNRVYIIDATFGDTDQNADPMKYFLINASRANDYRAIDIFVVDDTLRVNDISALYKGNVTDDARRQQYTQRRPVIVYSSR